MKTYLVWAIASFCFLEFMPSRSAAAALSLADCIGRVQTNSVQIVQAQVNEFRAKSAMDEAYRPMLPQLLAQGNLWTSSDVSTQSIDSNKAVFRLEQGTLPFGATWKLGAQRKAEYEAAHISQIESQQDVEQLVRQLYFSILRDQDAIQNSDYVEKEMRRLAEMVAPKFQIGNPVVFDSVKIKSAIFDLTRNRELLQSQLVGERVQLSQLIAIPPDQVILRPLSPPKPLVDIKTDSENPTLLGLRKQIEASEAAVSVAEAARLPTLGAAIEYGGTGQTYDTMVKAWSAQLQLRFTIFDWGLTSSQISQARSGVVLSQKKLELEKQRTDSELAQLMETAKAHLADQQRLQAMMPQFKRAATSSTDRYRHAAIGIIEATDAISLWLANLSNERAAFYSYYADLARIDRLTGGKVKFNDQN